jgi:integrase
MAKPGRHMLFKDDNYLEIQPEAAAIRVYDDLSEGLFCKVAPTGRRSWYLRYSPTKLNQVEIKLAPCGTSKKGGLTITEARKLAGDLNAGKPMPDWLAKKKADPNTNPKEPPALVVITFDKAAERFYNEFVLAHNSTAEQRNKRNARKRCDAFKDMDIKEITISDVSTLIASIRADGHAVYANRIRAYLSKLFDWCKGVYGLTSNPAKDVKTTEEDSREVFLTAKQIKHLGEVLRTKSEDKHRWSAVLPLISGARIGALANLKEGSWWEDERVYRFSKNTPRLKKLRILYVCPIAVKLIKEAPLLSQTVLEDSWDDLRALAELKAPDGSEITRHDLRTTWATHGLMRRHPLPMLKFLMGHNQVDKATRAYFLPMEESLQEISDDMGKYFWDLLHGKDPRPRSKQSTRP